MILNSGFIKLMDFGIAKDLHARSMTKAGLMLGSPVYMAPEQVEGGRIDERTDVYSIGVLLYRLTTGAIPYDGENLTKISRAILEDTLVSPREIVQGVNHEISSITLKAMSRQPCYRYQDCEDLMKDLLKVIKSRGTILS